MNNQKFILSAANLAKLAVNTITHPLSPKYQHTTGSLSNCLGLTKIGININVVAPGMGTTELHKHEFTDEFIYIGVLCANLRNF